MQMAQWLGLGLGLGIGLGMGLGSGFDYFRQSEPRTLVHGESSVRHLYYAEYRQPPELRHHTDGVHDYEVALLTSVRQRSISTCH